MKCKSGIETIEGDERSSAVDQRLRSLDMDKDTAKQIMVRMEACISLLSEVVQVAHANCGEHECRVVRRGIGHVLSEIQDRLTDPLYREYPDLLPQGTDYAPLEGPTLSEMATKVGQG